MKKYFIFMASAALMLAASCNKMEEVNTPVEPVVETELITVELNPMTKTALGAEGATTWSAEDKVSVTVGGKHIGDLTLVEGSTFSGEVEAGKSGEALLHYPSGVATVPTTQAAVANSFANGAALLDGTTTMEALREGTSVELKNSTALLQFTVAQAGDVTFEVGNTDYTVTGCETGKTYYACVAPAEGVALSYTIAGNEGDKTKASVTFKAGKVYDLKNLEIKKFVYLVPNIDWRSADAKFAAYFFGNGEKWIEMEEAESSGVYKCAVPGNYTNLIFCRMNPNEDISKGWDAKWDQTKDLVIPSDDKNYYFVEGWSQSEVSKWDTEDYYASYFPSDKNLYLLPLDKWKQNNERYAAYFFGSSGNTWLSLKAVSGCKYLSSSYYEVEIPEGYSNVIFCRMNGNTTENNWDNKWDQTADLTINPGDLYTITKSSSSWSSFSF